MVVFSDFKSLESVDAISSRKDLLRFKKIARRYSEMFQKSACLIIVKLPFSVSPGACHLWRKWAGLQQLGAGRTLLLLQLASQNQFHPPPCTFCLGSL